MRNDPLPASSHVAGSAIAAECAARGLRVLGLERFEKGDTTGGSSHGRSRIIRTAYFEGEVYVPLVQRAITLWQRLQDKHAAASPGAEPLLNLVGGLVLGKRDSDIIQGTRRTHARASRRLRRFCSGAAAAAAATVCMRACACVLGGAASVFSVSARRVARSTADYPFPPHTHTPFFPTSTHPLSLPPSSLPASLLPSPATPHTQPSRPIDSGLGAQARCTPPRCTTCRTRC